jgi:chromosome segregation ATPase
MPDHLTADDLARYRADYHQCRTTIVPLLDHVDAVTAERDEARAEAERLKAKVEKHERKLSRVCRLRDYLRDENARLQRQIEGHCERIAAQAELLSKRAEKGSEALAADIARLRALLLAVCRQHPEAVVTDGDTSCTLAHLGRRLAGEGSD